jgi:hypothetical protein
MDSSAYAFVNYLCKHRRLESWSNLANFLFILYAILTSLLAHYVHINIREVVPMAIGQAQYLYTVELTALENNLNHSIDRVARMREKAIKRNDLQAADQIRQLQRSINVAQRRITRLK